MDTPAAILEPARHLAHRPPFLFVDRAQVSADGRAIQAFCTMDPRAAYFEGHFPGDPIVPGVLLLECMAQAANLLLSHHAGAVVQGYLVGADEVRFNSIVRPGETIRAHVELLQDALPAPGDAPGRILGFRATAFIESRRCMRARVNIYHASTAGVPTPRPQPEERP